MGLVPSVAVVVPAFNSELRIGRCVEACLAQSVPPHEVVVVDNGSGDDTAAVARSAGAKVIVEPVRGSYRARNAGWRSTDAQIIAFTDADCVPETSWLEKLLLAFSDPTIAGAGGPIQHAHVRSITQRWCVARHLLDQERNFETAFLPFVATANAAYRRVSLEQMDGFEDQLSSGGDVDLAWRIQMFGGVIAYRHDAIVNHHIEPRLGEITSRYRRYATGHALLARRWRSCGAERAIGSPLRDGIWMTCGLPLRVVAYLVRKRPVRFPCIDTVANAYYMWGRLEGWRLARASPLDPLPGISAEHGRVYVSDPRGHRHNSELPSTPSGIARPSSDKIVGGRSSAEPVRPTG